MSAPEVTSRRERRERKRIDGQDTSGVAPCSPHPAVRTAPCTRQSAPCTLFYNPRVPIGTAFHERTAPLAESLSFRDWAGYYAVSAYETHHDHEYNAIRNACAVIDISPLFKYRVRGAGATGWSTAIITRDAARLAGGPGLVHALVRRRGHGHRRWHGDAAGRGTCSAGRRRTRTSAGWWRTRTAWTSRSRTSPSRWPRWPCRDRPRARCCDGVRDADRRVEVLPRHAERDRAACRWTSRAPATPATSATRSGCRGTARWPCGTRSPGAGSAFDLHAAGMLALDVARVEAGLLLIDVDFHSSRKALIDAQKYTPAELGLGAAGRPAEARLHRPPRARRRAAPRPRAADRGPGARVDGRRGAVRGGRPAAGRGGADLPRRGAGLQRPRRRSAARRPRRGRRR